MFAFVPVRCPCACVCVCVCVCVHELRIVYHDLKRSSSELSLKHGELDRFSVAQPFFSGQKCSATSMDPAPPIVGRTSEIGNDLFYSCVYVQNITRVGFK